MTTEVISPEQVKTANRCLYNAAAQEYESLDGRRSPRLENWLRRQLRQLRKQAPGDILLDIGAGSGLVCRCAEGIFPVRIGIDLSERILAVHRNAFTLAAAADIDHLPLADCSVDAVTCFAVLHHLYDFDALASEAARVLKPGGVFYSDHDMSQTFYRRFRLPLTLYRRHRHARQNYQHRHQNITPEIYESAEIHESGIDAARLAQLLQQNGFTVKTQYHWFGLNPVTDALFGQRYYPPGWAPLASFYAIKK